MNDIFICPICLTKYNQHTIDFALPYPGEELSIYRCSCGLGYSNYAVQNIIPNIYNESYYEHIRYSNPVAQKEYIKHLIPFFGKAVTSSGLPPSRKRLLDVGCATGDFLEYVSRRGWICTGIDISSAAIAQAKRKGLNAIHCTVDSLSAGTEKYDVITLWDVLEHLPDITKAMNIVMNRLSADGVIIIKTVTRTSLVEAIARALYSLTFSKFSKPLKQMYVPGHLYYFTPDVLRKFLSRFGVVLFVEKADTPHQALASGRMFQAALQGVFAIQRRLGMTYEIIAAVQPCQSNGIT